MCTRQQPDPWYPPTKTNHLLELLYDDGAGDRGGELNVCAGRNAVHTRTQVGSAEDELGVQRIGRVKFDHSGRLLRSRPNCKSINQV